MRVIFLDIDGVLHCSKTHNPRKLPYVIDPKLRRRFERLLEHTRAKVVLSSTWRYDPAGLYGAKRQDIQFIGVTPDIPPKPRRTKYSRG
jgi:HAD domain in Swiss Army Knife RNA repair proteins